MTDPASEEPGPLLVTAATIAQMTNNELIELLEILEAFRLHVVEEIGNRTRMYDDAYRAHG